MSSLLSERTQKNLSDILSLAIQYSAHHQAVVVADNQSPLARLLKESYLNCLPLALFIDFDSTNAEDIKAQFQKLKAHDLVVLIQSTSFRLDAFRIRVELFKQGLKVIEHPHLARMEGEEMEFYVDSLAYDPDYYHRIGRGLKQLIDQVQSGCVESGGETLVFGSSFENAKLNIGDYRDMANVGGQFPIGEVFTEATDLEAVNGRIRIFAFGDRTFSVNKVDTPITLVVEKGRVVDTVHSTPEFDQVLADIRHDEGEVWLRELGFGLNRAFTQDRIVCDIGTYERMCGIHLSLGAKHGIYNKPQFKRKDTWHHVDVFAVTECVRLDDVVVYRDGAWRV